MGSRTGDDDEKPPHEVELSAFKMGATPVTVAMWQEFCSEAKRPLPAFGRDYLRGPHYPIVGVNWSDAIEYGRWVSAKIGLQVSLPTEAQYEYAARGGMECKEYPWGDGFDQRMIWSSESPDASSMFQTGAVDRTSNIYRNGYGLSDVAGNINEWCLDWYHKDWYSSVNASRKDPLNDVPTPAPVFGEHGVENEEPCRVIRGGDMFFSAEIKVLSQKYRCASRGWLPPTASNIGLGFRIVTPA